MKTFITIKQLRFYLWVGAAWLFLWLLNALVNKPGTFALQSLNETWRIFFIVAVNFLFFEHSLPFILKKRQFVLSNILIGVLLISIFLVLLSFGLYAWRYLGIRLHIYTSFRESASIVDGASYEAQGGVTSILLFGILKHIYDYRKLIAATQRLRMEKQEAELNYLKSQTNPHFLFNTLNNIYSLAKDKSDLAPESILRLSKILRFMLYETGGEFISTELEIIRDYIALEKLRYDDSLRINFKYDVEDMNQRLPPLLMIPLVENAFKHGVSEAMDRPFVDIHLSARQQQLTFVVKNSAEAPGGEKGVKENIGLSNLRRQLELLYTDYNLSVRQDETMFTATLRINLASHV